MSYLGSGPAPSVVQFSTLDAQAFDGDGSTTEFTLNRAVSLAASIEVTVNNVQQSPYDGSYTVNGTTTLTFSEAPSSGTDNIYVRFLDYPLASITPADGSVGLDQLSATGTPSSSTYLRGDNTWAAVASSQWTTTGSDIYYNTGNVGVGTTSPTGKFNVVTDNTHNNGATFDSTGTTQAWFRDTDAGSNLKNWGIQSSGGDFNILKANDDRASGFVTPFYITTDGVLAFNSGYGSAATAYGCRAWVNFNGTGTVAIRASGNVSSITDGGTGDYTVNFTTAMPDANYCAVASTGRDTSGGANLGASFNYGGTDPTTSAIRMNTRIRSTNSNSDSDYTFVSIFR